VELDAFLAKNLRANIRISALFRGQGGGTVRKGLDVSGEAKGVRKNAIKKKEKMTAKGKAVFYPHNRATRKKERVRVASDLKKGKPRGEYYGHIEGGKPTHSS